MSSRNKLLYPFIYVQIPGAVQLFQRLRDICLDIDCFILTLKKQGTDFNHCPVAVTGSENKSGELHEMSPERPYSFFRSFFRGREIVKMEPPSGGQSTEISPLCLLTMIS